MGPMRPGKDREVMSIIPKPITEQLAFCETHASVWLQEFAGIGLDEPRAEEFKNLTTAARSAYDAAQAAKAAYRAAIVLQNNALKQAVGNAADLIRVIKGFAELSGDPNAVLGLAQIPPSAPPTPATAPGKPTDIAVVLEPSGAVTISWEAPNAAAGSGGFFNINRKLPGQASFAIIGGAPGSTQQSRRMSYTDGTIPTSAAATGAQYIIQGRRGTLYGESSDAIVVQFGVDGVGAGGGVGFTLLGGQSGKLAA